LFLIVSRLVKAAEGKIVGKKDEPPVIKECPFCCETVPIKATRCKFCTSELARA
jgi:large conductance mechanosensitive channel